MKPCSICKRDGIDPPALGSRIIGSRWNEGRQRYVVFNGYACEMHQGTFKSSRYLKKRQSKN